MWSGFRLAFARRRKPLIYRMACEGSSLVGGSRQGAVISCREHLPHETNASRQPRRSRGESDRRHAPARNSRVGLSEPLRVCPPCARTSTERVSPRHGPSAARRPSFLRSLFADEAPEVSTAGRTCQPVMARPLLRCQYELNFPGTPFTARAIRKVATAIANGGSTQSVADQSSRRHHHGARAEAPSRRRGGFVCQRATVEPGSDGCSGGTGCPAVTGGINSMRSCLRTRQRGQLTGAPSDEILSPQAGHSRSDIDASA